MYYTMYLHIILVIVREYSKYLYKTLKPYIGMYVLEFNRIIYKFEIFGF